VLPPTYIQIALQNCRELACQLRAALNAEDYGVTGTVIGLVEVAS
jgi:hypothetical protein